MFTFNDFASKASGSKSRSREKIMEDTSRRLHDTVDKSKEVVASSYDAVRKRGYVSAGRFEDIANGFNQKFNEHDKKLWQAELRDHIIANSLSLTLPTEEQQDEMYKEHVEKVKEEEEETKKEAAQKEQEKKEQGVEDIKAAMTGQGVDMDVVSRLFNMLFKEEAVAEPEAEEEAEVKPEPAKKEVDKGETQDQRVKDNPEEWKQCTDCNNNLSVMYEFDTCRHCRKERNAASEEPNKVSIDFDKAKKEEGKRKHRLNFDKQ